MNACRFDIRRWRAAVLKFPKARPLTKNVIEISDEVTKLTLRMLKERGDRSRRPADLQERHRPPVAVLRPLHDADPESKVLSPVRAVRKNSAVAITPPPLQVPKYPLLTGSQEDQNTT
jgi:hypothetical protein